MAHAVLKEVKIDGYRIPTNAVVVPNVNSVLMDPELFPNPEAFDPHRFLSKGRVSSPAHYIPFFFGEPSLWLVCWSEFFCVLVCGHYLRLLCVLGGGGGGAGAVCGEGGGGTQFSWLLHHFPLWRVEFVVSVLVCIYLCVGLWSLPQAAMFVGVGGGGGGAGAGIGGIGE